MDYMHHEDLCDKILKLEANIELVALLNKSGKLVARRTRDGKNPLYDEIHEKRWFNQIKIQEEISSMLDKICGKLHYSLIVRDHTKHITFYFNNHMLVVSLGSEASAYDALKIISSILEMTDKKEIMCESFG